MITVGYGDIVPISKNEKVYVLIVTLLSSAMFGYSGKFKNSFKRLLYIL